MSFKQGTDHPKPKVVGGIQLLAVTPSPRRTRTQQQPNDPASHSESDDVASQSTPQHDEPSGVGEDSSGHVTDVAPQEHEPSARAETPPAPQEESALTSLPSYEVSDVRTPPRDCADDSRDGADACLRADARNETDVRISENPCHNADARQETDDPRDRADDSRYFEPASREASPRTYAEALRLSVGPSAGSPRAILGPRTDSSASAEGRLPSRSHSADLSVYATPAAERRPADRRASTGTGETPGPARVDFRAGMQDAARLFAADMQIRSFTPRVARERAEEIRARMSPGVKYEPIAPPPSEELSPGWVTERTLAELPSAPAVANSGGGEQNEWRPAFRSRYVSPRHVLLPLSPVISGPIIFTEDFRNATASRAASASQRSKQSAARTSRASTTLVGTEYARKKKEDKFWNEAKIHDWAEEYDLRTDTEDWHSDSTQISYVDREPALEPLENAPQSTPRRVPRPTVEEVSDEDAPPARRREEWPALVKAEPGPTPVISGPVRTQSTGPAPMKIPVWGASSAPKIATVPVRMVKVKTTSKTEHAQDGPEPDGAPDRTHDAASQPEQIVEVEYADDTGREQPEHEADPRLDRSGRRQDDRRRSTTANRMTREQLRMQSDKTKLPRSARHPRGDRERPPDGILLRRLQTPAPDEIRERERSRREPDREPSDDGSDDGSSDSSDSQRTRSEPRSGPDDASSAGHLSDGEIARQESRARRHATRTLRSLKLPMPEYNGADDLDTYEAFVHKFDAWCRAKGLQGRYAVELLNYALTGKAATWYLRHVALDSRIWTMQEVYDELWKYCFPVSFREDMRKKLMRARQRGRPVKDFAQDIQNVASRYPDIDRYTIKRIFWDGVDSYIRLFWIDKGRSVEDSFRALIHYAKRAELRELERLRSSGRQPAEERTSLSPAKPQSSRTLRWKSRNGTTGRSATTGPRPQRNPRPESSRTITNAGARSVSVTRQEKTSGKSKPTRLRVGARLTPPELAEHRAQGLCFTCHKSGHDSRNCPETREAEPRGARIAAVAPAEAQRTQKELDKPRVRRKNRPVPAGLVRVMAALPVSADSLPPLDNPRTAPMERVRREYHYSLKNAPHPGTAIRAMYEHPGDRYTVASPEKPAGQYVEPGTLTVCDHLHNTTTIVQISSLTMSGPLIDIVPHFLSALGLEASDRERVYQANFRPTPWYNTGYRLKSPQSLIQGHWVEVKDYDVALEIGHTPGDPFILQSDAIDLWYRHIPTNVCYQVLYAHVLDGITVGELVLHPEFLCKRGSLVRPYPFAPAPGFGSNWSYPVLPSYEVLYAFARRIYWEQQQRFMAFEQDFPDYKPNFVREAVPFPGIPPSLYEAFGLSSSDWSGRDGAGTEAVGSGGMAAETGTPPELRQVASHTEDATGSLSSSGDCSFTSASSPDDASSGTSSSAGAAAVTQSVNATGVTAPAAAGFPWPLPTIVLRGSSLPETGTREDDRAAGGSHSVV